VVVESEDKDDALPEKTNSGDAIDEKEIYASGNSPEK